MRHTSATLTYNASDVSKPEMRTYLVTYAISEIPAVVATDASYYQVDDAFTTFKDTDNKTVYMIRNDVLISVERGEPCGSDPASGSAS
jgi:hypothetical protein